MTTRSTEFIAPPRLLLRQCRRNMKKLKLADSSGMEMQGGKFLTGAILFKRLLERGSIGADEKMVGVLLPPSVGGVLANAALALMNRVAVNLNYTLSNADVNQCIAMGGIKHVITSRTAMEKLNFKLDAEVIYLEDLKAAATKVDKAIAAAMAYAMPIGMLESMFGLTSIKPDDLLTVIFTSGSTGEPKGVMLSHNNVASNIESVRVGVNIKPEDVVLGVLPFFHSFGFAITLWLPMILDVKAVYHYNPVDARQVGKLCEKHGMTMILTAPTFLRTYLKRCDAEQLKTVNLVVTGAEKLPMELAKAWEEKFGVPVNEGYGTTELSPVAAVNVPRDRAPKDAGVTAKMGTVGRTLPGISAKVISPETGEDMGLNADGLLLIKGPNVMLGYLNAPQKTADVLKDGWYNTGDIARIDDDGFIQITGRQSRFSKIGGEMVPHIKVEEILAHILEDPDGEDSEIRVAVTAVPDEQKGERLIVVHKPLAKPLDQVMKELNSVGLPNLWIPGADSFIETQQIPVLGTGKLDLRGLKAFALEHAGQKGRRATAAS